MNDQYNKDILYCEDIPKINPKDDHLDYQHFSFELAKNIQNIPKSDNSYVIGIYGHWGDGKTTSLNFTKEYIKLLDKNPDYTIEEINEIFTSTQFQPTSKKSKTLSFSLILIDLIILGLIFYYIFLYPFPSIQDINLQVVDNIFSNYNDIYTNIIKYWFKFIMAFSFFLCLNSINKVLLIEINTKQYIEQLINTVTQKQNKYNGSQIIEFNPWNYTDQKSLLDGFFKHLSNELHFDSTNLSDLFIKYSSLILQKDLPIFSKILTEQTDLLQIKEQIKDNLKNVNQQIIIIIDDLDRMNADELFLTFQLVKLIADFPNVIYIMLFDKIHVINTLKSKFTQFENENYLDKLIQVGKYLPIIEESKLEKYFLNGIEKILKEKADENFINMLQIVFKQGLYNIYINNIRDVKRFINSLSFVYNTYKDEKVDWIDLIIISAIELFEPEAYWSIRKNKEIFTHIIGIDYLEDIEYNFIYSDFIKEFNKYNLILMRYLNFKIFTSIGEQIQDKKDQVPEEIKPFIDKFKIFYDKNHIDKISNVMNNRTYRRLRDKDSFYNYFKFNLPNNQIPFKILKKINNNINNFEEFNKLLLEQFNEDRTRIEDYFNYINKAESNTVLNTKEKILTLVKNFLLINDVKFLNYLFTEHTMTIIRYLIYDYNKGYNDKIQNRDIYNLLKELFQIENFDINLKQYWIIYLILDTYIFPIDNNQSWKDKYNLLSDEDKKDFDELKRILFEKLRKEEFNNNFKAIETLDWIDLFLDNNLFVEDTLKYILNKENEENFLNILRTGYPTSRFLDYGAVIYLFQKVDLLEKLRNRLESIKKSKKYDAYSSSYKDMIQKILGID